LRKQLSAVVRSAQRTSRAGDLYVSDNRNNRVLKLSAGSSTPQTLPFTDLSSPNGVAVDPARDVYVADTGNDRVVKLPAA
jgi:serine/threonine-protein kinase